MQTTLKLDDDVVALLREEVSRSRLSFQQVVNDALRSALQSGTPAVLSETRTHPLQLLPGIDPDRLNDLYDELETQSVRDRLLGEG
jgi:hypothetical protein